MLQLFHPESFNEDERLRVIRELDIADAEHEAGLDRVVSLVARHFDIETAFLSIVDRDRQWFKARIGFRASDAPRDRSFCGQAILSSEPLVILDATRDARFRNKLSEMEPAGSRFYAGVPLVVRGAAIGALCIADERPRTTLAWAELESLTAFAEIATDLINLRELRRGS